MKNVYGLVLIALAALPLVFSLGCSGTEPLSSSGDAEVGGESADLPEEAAGQVSAPDDGV